MDFGIQDRLAVVTAADRGMGRADAAGTGRDAMIAQLASQTAPRRVGRPAEFAAVVAFLCSERAGCGTGSSLMVDGGRVQAA